MDIKKFIKENEAEVLTTATISAVAGMGVMSVIQADKISAGKAKAKQEIANGNDMKWYKKIAVYAKHIVKPVLPIALAGGAAVASSIGMEKLAKKQKAKIVALTGALALESGRVKSLLDYKKEAEKMLGEKKAAELKSEGNKDIKKEVPEDIQKQEKSQANAMPEAGLKQMFVDKLSGQYIWSTIDDIQEGIRKIERRILTDPYGDFIPVNDLYYEWNIDYNTEIGKMTGFNVKWNKNGIDADLTGAIKTPSGSTATVIEFNWLTREEAKEML